MTDVSEEEYPAALSFLQEGEYHIYDYQFFLSQSSGKCGKADSGLA